MKKSREVRYLEWLNPSAAIKAGQNKRKYIFLTIATSKMKKKKRKKKIKLDKITLRLKSGFEDMKHRLNNNPQETTSQSRL